MGYKFLFDKWQVAPLMKNKQQSQNLLLKVALLFATNFFNLQHMSLLRDKLITQGEKLKTLTQNL